MRLTSIAGRPIAPPSPAALPEPSVPLLPPQAKARRRI